MAGSQKTTVTIDKSLLEQADGLAQQMDISRSMLVRLALASFVEARILSRPSVVGDVEGAAPNPLSSRIGTGREPFEIRQGDVYWVQAGLEGEMEPGIPHPQVVIQEAVSRRPDLSQLL